MKQQKTDRRSQRTYRLVSSAFAELVVEKPYDEILVQDIWIGQELVVPLSMPIISIKRMSWTV